MSTGSGGRELLWTVLTEVAVQDRRLNRGGGVCACE